MKNNLIKSITIILFCCVNTLLFAQNNEASTTPEIKEKSSAIYNAISGTEKKKCKKDCTKPCCAKKEGHHSKKKACKKDCTKPCCVISKEVK